MTDRTPRYLMAIALWVIVSIGLAYGIGQTIIKASALFTA